MNIAITGKPGSANSMGSVLIHGAGATLIVVLCHGIAVQNYLLFHAMVETFSIAVAWSILMLAWPARRFTETGYLLFLGFAYAGVGSLDLAHMLAYKGMGVISHGDANLATQLWIAARYLEALSLLIAPSFLRRRIPVIPLSLVMGGLVLGVLISIFGFNGFPDCFIEGQGITPFKRISEYIISGMVILAIWRLARHRADCDARLFRLMVASMALTALAELSFTAYISVYGLANQIGHLLKLFSFYLIYRGVIYYGLTEPYDLLFGDLSRRQEQLRQSNQDLQREIERRSKTEQRLLRVNESMRQGKSHLEERLEAETAKRHQLTRQVSEAVLRKASHLQDRSRMLETIRDLKEQNEVLRSQLTEYVRVMELARDDIDGLLSEEQNDRELPRRFDASDA